MARFIAGELVKATNTSPEWVKKVFGRELVAKQSNRRSQRRALVSPIVVHSSYRRATIGSTCVARRAGI